MAKQDFETLFGSSISDSKIIMEKVKNMPNCFVGWVESYNADNNTVNIQPAIQQYVSNSDKNGQNYANAPLLANVWVVGDNTEGIKKGDKALCFVLDQKSNAFFKATYDSTNSLARQTFKPLTNARKNITDCVAIILGDENLFQIIQDIIDGTIVVGNAKNITESINTSQIADGAVTLPKLSLDIQEVINNAVSINDFEYSASQNGYTKLPNGLILQWGKVGTYSTNGKKVQVFEIIPPIAFPNKCVSIVANLWSDDFTQGATSTNYQYYLATKYSENKIKISVRWLTQYTGSIIWEAIGY